MKHSEAGKTWRTFTLLGSLVLLLILGGCTQTVRVPEALSDAPSLYTTDIAYAPQNLGRFPGGTDTSALAVSADGTVVAGEGFTDAGVFAFRWTETSGMENLGTLPGHLNSRTTHLSESGSVVVGSSYAEDGPHAFRWIEAGGMKDIGTLPGFNQHDPLAINPDASVITGLASKFGGGAGATTFRWTEAGGIEDINPSSSSIWFTPLATNDDGTVIVGQAFFNTSSSSRYAARWTKAGGIEFLDTALLGNSQFTSASDVSADGSVIVGTASGHVFRWTEAGGVEDLGGLGSYYNHYVEVSSDGSVIIATSGNSRTFRWTAESGMQALPTPFSNSKALDMSDDGSVVIGTAASGQRIFRWTVTSGYEEMAPGSRNFREPELAAVSGDGSVAVGTLGLILSTPDGEVYENRAARWTLQTDFDDGDGIESSIDGQISSGTFYDESKRLSNYYTDVHKGGTTSGDFSFDVPGITVTVTDLVGAEGVQISAQGGGASEKAYAHVCYGETGGYDLELTSGDTVNVTCGSLLAEVVSGEVDVILSNGATVSIPQDATAFMDEQADGNFTVENRSASQSITITFEGRSRTVAPGESAAAAPQAQSDLYTVTFDGIPTRRVLSSVKLGSGIVSETGADTDNLYLYARRSDKGGNTAMVIGSSRELIISKDGRSQTSYTRGGNIIFGFTGFGAGKVTVKALSVAGVTTTGGTVEVFDGRTRVKQVAIPKTGASGRATLNIDAENVNILRVYLRGVGRVDDLVFEVPRP